MHKFIKIFTLLFIIAVIMISLNVSYCALGDGFDQNNIQTGTASSNLVSPMQKIWGVVLTVLQVASVSGIILAGVRYMFASADQKADLKKSMPALVIGIILVFSASTVIKFIVNSFISITGN